MIVLDASALLALAKGEVGAERVVELISADECFVSSVNMAEVGARLVDWGLAVTSLDEAMAQFGVTVAEFTSRHATISAELRPLTKGIGLSLGDRACLALAKDMGSCAVTADRDWKQIEEKLGVAIELIR